MEIKWYKIDGTVSQDGELSHMLGMQNEFLTDSAQYWLKVANLCSIPLIFDKHTYTKHT